MVPNIRKYNLLLICITILLSSFIISIAILYCNRYTYIPLSGSKIVRIDRYTNNTITQFIVLPYSYHQDDINRDYTSFFQ